MAILQKCLGTFLSFYTRGEGGAPPTPLNTDSETHIGHISLSYYSVGRGSEQKLLDR